MLPLLTTVVIIIVFHNLAVLILVFICITGLFKEVHEIATIASSVEGKVVY